MPPTNFRQYGKYIQFGTNLALSMVFPVLLGFWLDSRYETKPWFTLGGVTLGMVAVVWNMIKLGIETNNESKKNNK